MLKSDSVHVVMVDLVLVCSDGRDDLLFVHCMQIMLFLDFMSRFQPKYLQILKSKDFLNK